MKVVRVTDADGPGTRGFVEYHVDEKLRSGSGLSSAGLRVARLEELALAQIPPRDFYFYVNSRSFTVGVSADLMTRQDVIDLVKTYGSMPLSLKFKWGEKDGTEVLEVTTKVAFSAGDQHRIEWDQPQKNHLFRYFRGFGIARRGSRPFRQLVIQCISGVDHAAAEDFVRKTMLG